MDEPQGASYKTQDKDKEKNQQEEMDQAGGPTNSAGKPTNSAGKQPVAPPADQPSIKQPMPTVAKSAIKPQVDSAAIEAGRPTDSVGKPAGAKEVEYVPRTGVMEGPPPIKVKEVGEEMPEEVEGWLERVERDKFAQPQTVSYKGQPIVTPATPQKVSVTLPLTEEDLKKGLHYKLFESIRWLAEWCVRIVKKYHGKIAYKLSSKDFEVGGEE